KQRLLGHPFKERTQQLYNDIHFEDESYSYQQFITELIRDCIDNVNTNGLKLMPGVERVVGHLATNGIPMAIASSNDRHSYDGNRERFDHFFDHFSHAVLSGEKSEQIANKPDPHIYRVAYDRFADPKPRSPTNVLVFEDNEVGVRAAVGAGMPCVLVVDPRLNLQEVSQSATLVIKSMNNFRPELFGLPPLIV
ncbi:unnamed protein product, partial [Medioppia subpectinata]